MRNHSGANSWKNTKYFETVQNNLAKFGKRK